MTTPDPRAALLRAAGHPDAARLLEVLDGLDAGAARTDAEGAEGAPSEGPPSRPVAAPDAAEQADRRTGAVLAAQLYEDTSGRWGAPARGGEAA